MAFSFNGVGTMFYGQRDFRLDGTYVTTEWFVVFAFPVIPLRSLRVRYQGPGEHRWYLGFGSSDSYAVFEKSIPNWKQVLCTYGYVALLVGWIYFVVSSALSIYPHAIGTVSSLWIVFMACMIPVPTPWILRHYAQKKLRA